MLIAIVTDLIPLSFIRSECALVSFRAVANLHAETERDGDVSEIASGAENATCDKIV
jgi:hypothetical protein